MFRELRDITVVVHMHQMRLVGTGVGDRVAGMETG